MDKNVQAQFNIICNTDKYGFWKQQDPQPFDYSAQYKSSQSTNLEMSWLRMGWILGHISYGEVRNMSGVEIGAGNGCFVKVAKTVFKEFNAYDVNDMTGASIDETLLHHRLWDFVAAFDVLEHFTDIDDFWKINFRFAAISFPETPMVTSTAMLENWRHYKPNEHIYCLDWYNFYHWIRKHGCTVLACSCPEDAIRTRWDKELRNISSFIIKKENHYG